MDIWKIRVNNTILTDVGLTHKAFYLYVVIKQLAQKNKTLYVYKEELMDALYWKKNSTLKSYLLELKNCKIIKYSFNDLPKNKPLKIEILTNEVDNYTQVDTETIDRIKIHTKSIVLDDKVSDLKELAIRLFYVYEKYYNKKEGYARPPYKIIKDCIKTTDRYIKILNTVFAENNIVQIRIGKKYDNSNMRMNNTYIPMCNRE